MTSNKISVIVTVYNAAESIYIGMKNFIEYDNNITAYVNLKSIIIVEGIDA